MITTILFTVVHLLGIFLFCFWLQKKQENVVRPYFWPALLAKLGAGIGLGLIYKYYYSVGDTFNFFDDGVKLVSAAWNDPVSYINFLWSSEESDTIRGLLSNRQPRSLFLVKIISLINIFTGSNYWITSLYFSLASFGSAFFLFKRLTACFPESKLAAAIAFLFFPSVVFWSSGIIKESLGVAGLFLLSAICVALVNNRKPFWWEWPVAVLSVIVVWNLKYYWIAVFIPVAVTTLLVHFTTRNASIQSNGKMVIWVISFLTWCFGVTLVHPNFYMQNFLQVLVGNYHDFVRISAPENVIHYYHLEASWWSIIINSPMALLSGFFRPFIWEAGNVLQVPVAIENLFILLLSGAALVNSGRVRVSSNRLLILSTMVYVVVLCVFLALSTPNLGTLARYKVGFQPFLLFILLLDNTVLTLVKSKFAGIFS